MGEIMFKKIYYRWRLKRILNDKQLNRRLRCLEILKLLEGDNSLNKNINSLLNLKLNVLYSSILLYTKKIKNINYLLDRKSLISSDMLSSSPIVIIFDSFFTDQYNNYVDVNKSFESFIKECLRLVTLLADADDAEYGYYEHADRLLINVLQNIEEVLIKISIALYK